MNRLASLLPAPARIRRALLLVLLCAVPAAPAICTADDGSWVAGPPLSPRNGHSAIRDPVRDRMVVFGGYDTSYRNDVWALSLVQPPSWIQITTYTLPPSGRLGHTAVYDPVRDRMLVLGGYDGVYRNDVWELTLAVAPAWGPLAPSGTPPSARQGHVAIYDPVRDRMVVFGGSDPSFRSDVWVLSLAGTPAWSQLAAAGTPPSGRYGHAAIYDPVRDRVVVFGGYDSGYRYDVWALSLAGTPAWSQLAPTGTPPSGRYEHTAIYDSYRDRMVVFGGFGGSYRNDVWALSLTGTPAWSQLAPTGTPPPGRYGHVAIYDSRRDDMVLYAGSQGYLRNLDDCWRLLFPSDVGVPAVAAARVWLGRVEPNPTRGDVLIPFALPVATRVSLRIFDAAGRVIRTLEDAPVAAGAHSRGWDLRTEQGSVTGPGVYFCELRAGGERHVRRVAVLR